MKAYWFEIVDGKPVKRRPNESYRAWLRRIERNADLTCRCSGWWFPHRRSSKSAPIKSGPDAGERYGCFEL